MPNIVRVYAALLRAAWLRALEYRAQLILWLVASIFPLVMMAVWLTLVNEVGVIQGWTQADFVSYYIASTIVSQMTAVWVSWDWDEGIRTGSLSVKLLKPLNPIHDYFVLETLGWKLLIAAIIVPPIVVISWLSPDVTFGASLAEFIAFIVCCLLAILFNLFFATCFGLLAFWTTQSRNFFGLMAGFGHFLSGFIAPLPMFPDEFQTVAALLPFRSTLGLPVEILMGRLTWQEIGSGLLITAVWALIFFVLYRFLWRHGLKRYEAVGA